MVNGIALNTAAKQPEAASDGRKGEAPRRGRPYKDPAAVTEQSPEEDRERKLFEAAFKRLLDITGNANGKELSEWLGVSLGTVYGSRKKCVFPAEFILAAVERKKANPVWIRTGKGPRYLMTSDVPPDEIPDRGMLGSVASIMPIELLLEQIAIRAGRPNLKVSER